MDEEEQQQVGDELRRFQSKSTAKPASLLSLARVRLGNSQAVCCYYWDQLRIRPEIAVEFTISAFQPQLCEKLSE